MTVLQQLTVKHAEDGLSLLAFVETRLDLSRRAAKKVIDSRRIHVNRRRVWIAKHPLRSGDSVDIALNHERQEYASPSVILQKEDLIILNKPPGMLTVDDDASLEVWARTELTLPDLRCVHRLDRDTSGCVIAIPDESLFKDFKELFRLKRVDKHYRAIVHGDVGSTKRTIDQNIDGKRAISHLVCISSHRRASFVEMTIETGRTHQIRRHLSAIRHPVAGDSQYGNEEIRDQILRAVPRQMLHAHSLQFKHPASGRDIDVAAPMPADFRACLNELGLKTS